MNVPLDKLTAWNRFAELARSTAITARLCCAKGDREKGRYQLMELERAAAAASVDIEAAGADRSPGLPEPSGVPLGLLDTPASRRYAHLMREAYEAAREVDQERGYGNDGPADALASFVEAAELDVFGPAGMVKE